MRFRLELPRHVFTWLRFRVKKKWLRLFRLPVRRSMKKNDVYISGPHSYWFHFIVGLLFGGLLGWWFFGDISERAVVNLLAVGVTAVCLACFCGRWGEPAWRRVSDWLAWWFGTLR